MTLSRFILLLGFLHLSIVALSQDVPDSFDPAVLDAALQKVENDTNRFEIYMRLGEAYRIDEPEKARFYYNKVLNSEPKTGFENFHSRASMMLAILSQYKSDYDSCLFYSTQAIAFAELSKDTSLIIRSTKNKSEVLKMLNRPVEAAELIVKSIHLAKAQNDTFQLARALLSLVNLKARYQQYEEAIVVIHENEALWSKSNPMVKAQFQLAKATIFSAQEKYEESITEFQKVYPVFKQMRDPYNFLTLLHNLSNTCLSAGELEQALSYNKEALLIQQSIGDARGLGFVFLTRARITLEQDALDTAAFYAEKAVLILQEQEEPKSYLNAIKTWSEIEAKRENWKKSKELSDKAAELSDTFFQEARIASLDSLMLIHEVAEKEAALRAAQQDLKIQELSKQRMWLGIGVFSLLAMALGVIFSLRKRHQIQLLAKERDQKEQELSLAREQLKFKLEEISYYQGNVAALQSRLELVKSQKQPVEEKLGSADIFNILKRNVKKEADWKLFEEYFAHANPQFISTVREKHAELTAHDIRLMALLRLNLNSNEIAVLFNIAPDSVRKARYRLTKKLELEGKKELYQYVMDDL